MADWPYNGARWQRLRKAKLGQEPLCQGCAPVRIMPAKVVDHIKAISDGGDPFPPLDGLRSYCLSCHSQKTARGSEAGAVKTSRPIQARKGCDANGMPLDPKHPWHDMARHDIDTTVPTQGSAHLRTNGDTRIRSDGGRLPSDRLSGASSAGGGGTPATETHAR